MSLLWFTTFRLVRLVRLVPLRFFSIRTGHGTLAPRALAMDSWCLCSNLLDLKMLNEGTRNGFISHMASWKIPELEVISEENHLFLWSILNFPIFSSTPWLMTPEGEVETSHPRNFLRSTIEIWTSTHRPIDPSTARTKVRQPSPSAFGSASAQIAAFFDDENNKHRWYVAGLL